MAHSRLQRLFNSFSQTFVVKVLVGWSVICSPTANALAWPTLAERAAQIYSKDNERQFEPCDFVNKAKVLEIAQALDKPGVSSGSQGDAALALEKLSNTENTKEAKTKYQTFGPFTFERTVSEKFQDRWDSYYTSWEPAFTTYEKIKNSPESLEWGTLDYKFRSHLLHNDQPRIDGLRFMGVTRDSESKLIAIDTKLKACIADPSCVKPGFSNDEREFITSSGIYKRLISYLEDPKLPDEMKRSDLVRFENWLKLDLHRFKFRLNPFARIEGKTLIIPLDMTIFKNDAGKLVAEIEKVWNTDKEYKIKIEQVQPGTPAYKVVFQEPGNRSSVSYIKQVIQLRNYDSLTEVAHEFGHVIGFPDTYYVTWDKNKCAYKTETNEGDLMSGSYTGEVLPSHWTEIKKQYWNLP